MGTTRTLDQRVAGIRKKLGADARTIETLYGRGYRYAVLVE
jgi:DNA-binding response OmpR family regulator